ATLKINNSFQNDNQCEKPLNIFAGRVSESYVDSSRAYINSSTADTINIINARIRGLLKSGTVKVFAYSSVDAGLNQNISFVGSRLPGKYYWIGGTGNWDDYRNWATVSGGTSSGCVPLDIDTIVFDDNSF